MTKKETGSENEPVSEKPQRVILEQGPDAVEESGSDPAVTAGTLSVVYTDGLDNPPNLVLSGAPGVPETLLVVDAAGTPVAQYTAGPVATAPGKARGMNHANGLFLPAGHSAVVPGAVVAPVGLLSDQRIKADITPVVWSR